jgi:DNA-binding IscR family transcriptional regulator
VPIDPSDVANLVERRFPRLESRLISAVRFSRGESGGRETNSPRLMAAVVRAAERAVAGFDFKEVLNPGPAVRSLVSIVATVALAAIPALAAPEMTRLWFSRNVLLQETPWPKRTRLIVELRDGELLGARGDDLVVQASAEGVAPRDVEFFYETQSGVRGRHGMVMVGSQESVRYRYTFKGAQEPFSFYLQGGDDQTEVYQARLVDRPELTTSRIEVTPPAYAKLPQFTVRDGERAAQMLPGSRVVFHIETNKPVERAVLMAGTEQVTQAEPRERGFVAEFVPTETRLYHFALVDDLGFESKEEVKFALRVMKDEAPQVRLKISGVGEMVTPQALLPLEAEYADTYGLATAELLYRLTHEDMRQDTIPLPGFEPQTLTFSTSLEWPIAGTPAAPGDQLALLARASDSDDVSGPNVAESPEQVFRVVTPEELIAELNRREQEFRADFERLIDAQEQVRGELLTLMGPAGPAAASPEFSSSAASLERRQRSIAQSVNVVRQQAEQILQELQVNQLLDTDTEERLGNRIAEPLTELSRRDLPRAADQIRQWSRDGSTQTASQIDPQQVALLSQMRQILANMIQWEGYQEAVTMLRDILRLQNELRSETQKAVEKQGSDVFDN